MAARISPRKKEKPKNGDAWLMGWIELERFPSCLKLEFFQTGEKVFFWRLIYAESSILNNVGRIFYETKIKENYNRLSESSEPSAILSAWVSTLCNLSPNLLRGRYHDRDWSWTSRHRPKRSTLEAAARCWISLKYGPRVSSSNSEIT